MSGVPRKLNDLFEGPARVESQKEPKDEIYKLFDYHLAAIIIEPKTTRYLSSLRLVGFDWVNLKAIYVPESIPV